MPSLADKAFAKLQKLNSNATTLEENTLSNVTEWVDTGCLVLNSILVAERGLIVSIFCDVEIP